MRRRPPLGSITLLQGLRVWLYPPRTAIPEACSDCGATLTRQVVAGAHTVAYCLLCARAAVHAAARAEAVRIVHEMGVAAREAETAPLLRSRGGG